MGISLQRIERRKLEVGLNRLGRFGIDVDRWLAFLDADDRTMQRIVGEWPNVSQTLRYDAIAMFGWGSAYEHPLPQGREGEVVIRYGGWSFRQLLENVVVRQHKVMSENRRYSSAKWMDEKLPAGIYYLRQHLERLAQDWHKQKEIIPSGSIQSPLVLNATAAVAHHLQTGKPLFEYPALCPEGFGHWNAEVHLNCWNSHGVIPAENAVFLDFESAAAIVSARTN